MTEKAGVVAVFRPRIARISGLREILGASEFRIFPRARDARHIDAVVGWGHKQSGSSARAYASRHGLPYLRLEDGFFRSIRPGDARPLSLIVDDRGIYYDARSTSLLESWLNAPLGRDPLADDELRARARRAVEFILETEISKYNNTQVGLPRWLERETRELVLVVDQRRGDQSIEGGLSDASTFQRMVDCALDEHPRALVLLKAHPDVLFRHARGNLSERTLKRHDTCTRLRWLADPINPVALVRRVDHVYVCTSQLGFEALLANKPVTCFGAGFYSGWGLTDDRVTVSRRERKRSLPELAAAALLLYPRYLDPITRTRCTAEVVFEHLALQRRRFRENRGATYCFGFTPWKRRFVRKYLESPSGTVRFCATAQEALRHGACSKSRFVVWGQRRPEDLGRVARELGVSVTTMEDGFLRSVGLGSDFTRPASLVLDRTGIYYAPSPTSELENILQHADFTPAELEAAAHLRAQVVAAGLSKYNSTARVRPRIEKRPGQRLIFVPGQVEDDASILLGASAACGSNAALLREARRSDPDAFVVYKPHPDVSSGNRGSAPVPSEAFDQQVTDASIGDCLELADEVHTMTSLVGFEALLRGTPVVVYGRPFYAGWGLTKGELQIPGRTRRLTLDQLVTGALIRYPRYYSFAAGAFTTAFGVVTELSRQRDATKGSLDFLSRRVRRLGKLMNLLHELTHA